jgi:hypothetical protein
MILPQTAAKYDGMCAHCGKTSEKLRIEAREYKRNLETGTFFLPSEEELGSVCIPQEFGASDTLWNLDSDYYTDTASNIMSFVISQGAQQTSGHVFLISSSGGRLNLSFSEIYGVCEYHNQNTGERMYAYTQHNLREQVSEVYHVVQACPCCGVGMLWFPSRCHMPRKTAFDIVVSLVSGTIPSGMTWLNSGD